MNYTRGKNGMHKSTVDAHLSPANRWQPKMRSLLQAGAQAAIRNKEERERWERGDYSYDYPESEAQRAQRQHQREEEAKHGRHFTDGLMGGATFKKGDIGCD